VLPVSPTAPVALYTSDAHPLPTLCCPYFLMPCVLRSFFLPKSHGIPRKVLEINDAMQVLSRPPPALATRPFYAISHLPIFGTFAFTQTTHPPPSATPARPVPPPRSRLSGRSSDYQDHSPGTLVPLPHSANPHPTQPTSHRRNNRRASA